MIKKPLVYVLCLMSSIYGCSLLDQPGEGYLKLGVAFPRQSFNLKAIPVDTATINVAVSGAGLASDLNFNLTRTAPSSMVKVPLGRKDIKATAIDSSGKVLATGSASVVVILNTPGQPNRAEVELTAIGQPSAIPTPNNPGSSSGSSTGTSVTEPSPVNSDSPQVPVDIRPSATPAAVESNSTPRPSPTSTSTPFSNGGSTTGGGLSGPVSSGGDNHTITPSPTATGSSVTARASVVPDTISVRPVSPTPSPSPTANNI